MTEVPFHKWSDENTAESFRSEIQARFKAHNVAFRARDAIELEAVLREHPDRREHPGFKVRDSGAWGVYQASEIRIDRNVVTVVLPRGVVIGVDLVHLFDHTSVAWSRPLIGATIVDGEARPTIEIVLVATWNDALAAAWRGDGNDRRQVLVELFDDDVRSLAEACVNPHHGACNCGDYLPAERPCTFCAGMPVRAEVLFKIHDRLRLALEPLP